MQQQTTGSSPRGGIEPLASIAHAESDTLTSDTRKQYLYIFYLNLCIDLARPVSAKKLFGKLRTESVHVSLFSFLFIALRSCYH
jgi:hypothetical protein